MGLNEAGAGSRQEMWCAGYHGGFTLAELALALAALAILAALAVPMYASWSERSKRSQAATTIRSVSNELKAFELLNERFPASLAEMGETALRDPWGSPYQYLVLRGAPPAVRGRARKDKNLVPINSDFDLYSVGPDGESLPPLTAKKSQDDIVRAQDGAFVGLASEY